MAKATPNTTRRREVRKSVPRRRDSLWAILRERRTLWAVLYILTLSVGTLAINQWLGNTPRHYLGQLLEAPIVARVDFDFENVHETRLRQQQAERNQLNVYTANEPYMQKLKIQLDNLLTDSSDEVIKFPEDTRERIRKKLDRYLDDDDQPIRQWEINTQAFLRKLFDLPIIRHERYLEETAEDNPLQRITIIHPDPLEGLPAERESTKLDFFSIDSSPILEENVAIAAEAFNDDVLQQLFTKLVLLDPQPTYLINRAMTEDRRTALKEEVEPAIEPIKTDKVMLPTGRLLSQPDLDLIAAEHKAYQDAQDLSSRLLRIVGSLGSVILIGCGLWIYIFAYQYRITRNPMRGLAVTALLLLSLGLSVGLSQLHPQFIFGLAAFPPLLIAIVLAIAYDQRFALAAGVFASGLVLLNVWPTPTFALSVLAGVGLAVAMLNDVRTRSKLVEVGAWCGLAMAMATLVGSLMTRPLLIDGILPRILWDSLYAGLAGLGTGLLVQGILPAIEQAFKVTTAMTLRELNDASHPLLQRLAQEAPGTYQHSLRIADMAEGAADRIGADGLLCRVGAMYHDVGKVNKPLYFIENQGGGPNRHNKLSPAMSLLIIVGHVKDGVEMAREYGLPPELRHFIESHHGTTLVEYFYHAARKLKEAEEEQVPSEFEFRYPGPKPQTKEAAIMLLCDSVEAAARVLDEPTPIRIEQLVDKMATKRLMDGQFDECNLTLAELHKIQKSLTKTLCAIHHTRIKYPGGDKPKPAAVEQPQTQSA